MYSSRLQQNQNCTDHIVAEELLYEAFQREEELHDLMIHRNCSLTTVVEASEGKVKGVKFTPIFKRLAKIDTERCNENGQNVWV